MTRGEPLEEGETHQIKQAMQGSGNHDPLGSQSRLYIDRPETLTGTRRRKSEMRSDDESSASQYPKKARKEVTEPPRNVYWLRLVQADGEPYQNSPPIIMPLPCPLSVADLRNVVSAMFFGTLNLPDTYPLKI